LLGKAEESLGEVSGFGPMRHSKKRHANGRSHPEEKKKKEREDVVKVELAKKEEKKKDQEEDEEECLGYTTKEKEEKHAAWRRQTSALWKAMTATLKPLLAEVVAARKSSSKPKKTTCASKPSPDSSTSISPTKALLRDEAAMARLCETFAAQMKQLHDTIEEHQGSRSSQDPKKMIRAVVLFSARPELSAPSRERLTALLEPLKALDACMWKHQMCACTCHLCENCGGSGGDCCPLEYTENCECNC